MESMSPIICLNDEIKIQQTVMTEVCSLSFPKKELVPCILCYLEFIKPNFEGRFFILTLIENRELRFQAEQLLGLKVFLGNHTEMDLKSSVLHFWADNSTQFILFELNSMAALELYSEGQQFLRITTATPKSPIAVAEIFVFPYQKISIQTSRIEKIDKGKIAHRRKLIITGELVVFLDRNCKAIGAQAKWQKEAFLLSSIKSEYLKWKSNQEGR